MHKKLISGIICLSALFFAAGCGIKKQPEPVVPDKKTEVKHVVKQKTQKQEVQEPDIKKETSDLYSENPYYMPLSSIVEISKLSPEVKKSVDKLLEEAQGIYLIQKHKDKTIIFLQNPINTENTYVRHNLQTAEISADGEITYHNIGYNGKDGEMENPDEQFEDVWEFDKTREPYRPLKHISYGENNKKKFTETWNYDEKEPIKYQIQDSDDKVISVLSETLENESTYRHEHIFYDKHGNIDKSISINYNGADISRIVIYDTKDFDKSVSIINEYTDGQLTKEKIYDKDYQLINTYESTYNNNKRTDIKVFDKDEKEIEAITD